MIRCRLAGEGARTGQNCSRWTRWRIDKFIHRRARRKTERRCVLMTDCLKVIHFLLLELVAVSFHQRSCPKTCSSTVAFARAVVSQWQLVHGAMDPGHFEGPGPEGISQCFPRDAGWRIQFARPVLVTLHSPTPLTSSMLMAWLQGWQLI